MYHIIGVREREKWASQVVLVVKNLPAHASDVRHMGSSPGLTGFPGEGNGNPLQYSLWKKLKSLLKKLK